MTTTILRTLAETQPWAQLSNWIVPQHTDLPTCVFPLTGLSFWRQQVYSITLTFSWTLTNAQTPTQNLPLLRSTKSRGRREIQQKMLIPVPHPDSSCWQPNTATPHPHPQTTHSRNWTIPSKGNEKSPLPGNTLTHILLSDRVGPAVVTKHLIGQINYPVTLNVTHLEKTLKKTKLVKISCHTYMQIKINLFLTSLFDKTALQYSRAILSEPISKILPEGAS